MVSSYASRAAASAAARSAGRSERTSRSSPVTGWVRRSSARAGTGARGRARDRGRTRGRRPPGFRSTARWTRIWWVRPVPSVPAGASGPASASTSSNSVTASRGRSVSSDIRVGSRRSRPMGASMRPLRERRPAAHERRVGAADPPPAQLRLEPGMGAGIAGHKRAARRCRGRAGGRCPGGPRRRPRRRPRAHPRAWARSSRGRRERAGPAGLSTTIRYWSA